MPRVPVEPPATIQQMLGSPPARIQVGNKVYLLGFDVQDAKGRLEAIVGAKVWEQVYAESDRMPAKIKERHVKETRALFASGYYATMGDGWRAEVLTPSGAILFFLSLLQEHQPDITFAEASEIWGAEPERCSQALGTVAPDFFAACLRQMGFPEAEVAKAMPQISEAFQMETLATS